MNIKVINLNEHYHIHGGKLTCYSHETYYDGEDKDYAIPAMICVPGGGYYFCSNREGEPIALEFLARRYQAFVLTYECNPDGACYPEQLLELACAVDYIKKNAKEFHVDPTKVFAVGFSAGGHLTASLGTDYKVAQKYYGEKLDCKLTGQGLCYPVINDEYGHVGSKDYLLQFHKDPESILDEVRLDKGICEDTSPAFIWSTFDDDCVPCTNAIMYAKKMKETNIKFELHVWPTGPHGLSTAKDMVNNYPGFDEDKLRVSCWIDMCDRFMKSL